MPSSRVCCHNLSATGTGAMASSTAAPAMLMHLADGTELFHIATGTAHAVATR